MSGKPISKSQQRSVVALIAGESHFEAFITEYPLARR
ncbi:MAG: hypothetical protein ACI8W1_000659 [Candidatus Azotimanducaceae bacterium]|jgi:hypothetical protein